MSVDPGAQEIVIDEDVDNKLHSGSEEESSEKDNSGGEDYIHFTRKGSQVKDSEEKEKDISTMSGEELSPPRGRRRKSLECDYPMELTFIEPEKRVGTRVSYRGRKGSVTCRVNCSYNVAFDDSRYNTRKSGYPPSDLLVLDSNDKEIPMIDEEYHKGKSVAKHRGAAKQKSLEYTPTCDYPKELSFIEPENRLGTRVSYNGRKGKVTSKLNRYNIVTFDSDGIVDTRHCGYPPSELLVLDSNDNEIPMTEEEYQKGKAIARQRGQNSTEYTPTCDYPKELTFIEPENRLGMRISYCGRKGNVKGKVKSRYSCTFDSDGNTHSTRKGGYTPRELLVLDSNDNEIPMTKEEYQKGKTVARARGHNVSQYKGPPCDYPQELTFIEPKNRLGMRISYRGRKGKVKSKVKSSYTVAFDDGGHNTRKGGYLTTELLVLDSNDMEIPMIEEEYHKGKSVAKQRGAAKQKSLEYKPTCDYPKTLSFIEPENRLGTRVSYRGRKGKVTSKLNRYSIVTFDDIDENGNNSTESGYPPSELLVLDSNDNEIPMIDEEYGACELMLLAVNDANNPLNQTKIQKTNPKQQSGKKRKSPIPSSRNISGGRSDDRRDKVPNGESSDSDGSRDLPGRHGTKKIVKKSRTSNRERKPKNFDFLTYNCYLG